MKITDLKCAIIGQNPVVRIVTDEGLVGYGAAEANKSYLKPYILDFKPALLGQDPTDVERVMLRIRQRGAFKPFGSAVSAIEMALWDLAGKAAGVPGLQAPRRQGPRPRPRLQRRGPRAPDQLRAGRLCRACAEDAGRAGRLHDRQGGDRLSRADLQ